MLINSKLFGSFCVAVILHIGLFLHLAVCSHNVEADVVKLKFSIVPEIISQPIESINKKVNNGLKTVVNKIPKTELKYNKPKSKSHGNNNILPVISAPKFLHYEAPLYPKSAQRQKQQGVVIVDVTVEQGGAQKFAHVYQSSGYYLLDNAAVAAANKSRFDMHADDVTSQEYIARIKYQFKLRR